ncbi:MAG: hypothetical protein ABEK04_05055, partial [Candidatus Nanohalobium sp.]
MPEDEENEEEIIEDALMDEEEALEEFQDGTEDQEDEASEESEDAEGSDESDDSGSSIIESSTIGEEDQEPEEDENSESEEGQEEASGSEETEDETAEEEDDEGTSSIIESSSVSESSEDQEEETGEDEGSEEASESEDNEGSDEGESEDDVSEDEESEDSGDEASESEIDEDIPDDVDIEGGKQEIDSEDLESEEVPEEDHEDVEYSDTSLDEVHQTYKVESDDVPAKIMIGDKDDEYVPIYYINRPQISLGTEAFVDNVRQKVIENVQLTREEFTDSDEIEMVKKKFSQEIEDQLDDLLPDSDERAREILVGNLIHEMVGLGDIEILLADPRLEELVVNSADEPTWVYHQEHGWLKSNLTFEDEEEIYNYSSEIARRVGKNISSLDPLLDAHLPTG